MSFHFQEARMHLMPVIFGPGGTPRENRDGKRYVYDQPIGTDYYHRRVVCEIDPSQVESLLPERITLNAPYIIISHSSLRNVAWLAGNGYEFLSVEVPASFEGREDKVKGSFMLVVWENHADPIITGREQLGFNKIYADIEALPEKDSILVSQASSWGFRFLEMRLDMSREPENPDELLSVCMNKEHEGVMHYKFIPKTGGDFTEADANYIAFAPNKWDVPPDVDLSGTPKAITRYCRGEVKWNRPTWEQMPTQSHIVQKLSSIEIKRYAGAYVQQAYSANDRKSQRILI